VESSIVAGKTAVAAKEFKEYRKSVVENSKTVKTHKARMTGPPSAELQISIELNDGKNVFQRGEIIKITVTNIGEKPVTLPNAAPWSIYQLKDNKYTLVFSPVAAQVLTSLNPGEAKSWTWNQKLNDGS
jgi:hypothetical protein